MMFSLIIFHGSAMDGHSKHEMLETLNMNKKNIIARFLFLNWPCDVSRDLLTQYLYSKMFRTMGSLCVPNFNSAP